MSTGPAMRRVIATVCAMAVVTTAWYLVSYVAMDEARRSVALPPPHRILRDAVFRWEDRRGIKPILESMLVTGRVALIGLALSAVLGIGVAVLMNRSKMLEWAIFPYAVIVQTLPVLALVPIIKIWFDTGIQGRVFACVLVSIFPVITNTLFGLQSTDPGLHDLFTLCNANRWTRLWKLELPAARPAIFTGLRIAAGASVIGAIVGDFFFRQGEVGIGRLIDNYQKDARTTELFAAAAVSSLFGVSIFVVFGIISRRTLRYWHDTRREHS